MLLSDLQEILAGMTNILATASPQAGSEDVVLLQDKVDLISQREEHRTCTPKAVMSPLPPTHRYMRTVTTRWPP